MQRLIFAFALLTGLAFNGCTERSPYGSDPAKAKSGVGKDTMRRDNTNATPSSDTSASGGVHNGGL